MQPKSRLSCSLSILMASLLCTQTMRAQHDHGAQHPATKAEARVGDAYPFDTCPISGKKLGAMGKPVVKLFDGREVRFCCGMCPAKFEKDLAANLARLDDKIVKDQVQLYPLKTSVVTGKDLPEHPVDFTHGNRLVRLGSDKERAEFLKSPEKFLAQLDQAVIAAQNKDYPLTECPVSGEKLGGDMGKPVDLVVAGRLIRLCCKNCKKTIDEEPAKFLAMIDARRQGGHQGKDHQHKEGEGATPHHGK